MNEFADSTTDEEVRFELNPPSHTHGHARDVSGRTGPVFVYRRVEAGPVFLLGMGLFGSRTGCGR